MEDQGYLVIKDFITKEECQRLKSRIQELVPTFPPSQSKEQNRYFLESATTIKPFFEVDDATVINKIGHALHTVDPIFREFSYHPRIFDLAKGLGVTDPIVVQSMWIFKNPRIGGEVTCHQDGTFLYTEPDTTLGLWFAMEDATIENGCLWVIPGGHLEPLRSRFVRTPDGGTKFNVVDSRPWDLTCAVPLEVTSGTLVVLHSRLPHLSYTNRSDRSRQAYTLHLIGRSSSYPADNWLQL